ncbi:MAG: stage IV sporulation protein A [Clostridia bacterium]|nr:stage IV sporulation protein A [Clostridia bacterium]
MADFDIFQDIAQRTGGDIYIGVVGPVRTGKSTFIKRFVELLVLPNIDDPFERERTVDAMPQSGAGRTIMTTEPKFVPDEAVTLGLGEGLNVRVRLVDSVGFPVEGALGYSEAGGPRMVTTPWFDYEVPFEEAAEIGTRKVIADHSTVGLVITTDGSFGEIPREAYTEAEQRAVRELRELGKPFLVILNTAHPDDPGVADLAAALSEEYGVTVLPLDCARADEQDLRQALEELLYEFPVRELSIETPGWVEELENTHWLRRQVEAAVSEAHRAVHRLRDVDLVVDRLAGSDLVERVNVEQLDLGSGTARLSLELNEALFYRVLEEIAGVDVRDQRALVRLLRDLVREHSQFARVRPAWEAAAAKGYGITQPTLEDMVFEEPQLVRKGKEFGVRLYARAACYHIIRGDVEAEYTPMLGSERQSEDLVRYLTEKFEDDPRRIWDSNIFGKSLNELLRDGIRNKVERIPEGTQKKLQEAISRITNEGGGTLICIIL